MFNIRSKPTHGATLVEYGIMVGLVAVLSVVALGLMGRGVSDTMETSSGEIGEASEAAAGSSTATAPGLNELTAAQISSLDTNGSLIFSDGTIIFVNGPEKEGPQSLQLVDAENVTLRWNAPSDCPVGPFTAVGSTVINCDYTDATAANVPLYVRVPGDGFLTSSEKTGTGTTVISTCERTSTDRTVEHDYLCSNAS